MEPLTGQEMIDSFLDTVRKYEPYPMEQFLTLCFDDDRFPDRHRLAASFSLYALLEMGFKEDEVNPWKNKN